MNGSYVAGPMATASYVDRTDLTVAKVLLDIAVITIVARALGGLAVRLRQPAVMGEIVAGLALGPSLLGLFPGHLDTWLFPADGRPFLNVVAQLGLVLFMFLVGYELETGHLRGGSRVVSSVSTASIVLPFGLGFALAAALYGRHDHVAGHHVRLLALALFMGAAMAITAFPVLARVLVDSGLRQQRIGVLSLMCAAVNDVVAWVLLAVVITIVRASSPLDLVRMFVELLAFALVLVVVVRPLLRRLVARMEVTPRSESVFFVVAAAGLLVASWATAAIGLHAVFGAFAFGAVMPRAEIRRAVPEVPAKVGQLSVLLLPVFFAITGLSVNLAGLGWNGVLELCAIVVLACVGKYVGAAGAARLSGLDRHDAAVLGVLMNTRGLTELIILGVGLDMRVLDDRLFTSMVVMAVITTVMAGPLLRRMLPAQSLAVVPGRSEIATS
jgi:Kef-type K+ transport system membrane component KefB